MVKSLRSAQLLIVICSFLLQAQNEVNFTTIDGFSDGALYNQTNWSASNQAVTWVVDAQSGVVSTVGDWKRAAWQQGFVLSSIGDAITLRVDFNMSGTFTAQNNPLMNFGFGSGSNVNDALFTSNKVYLSTRVDPINYSSPILHLRDDNDSVGLLTDAYLIIQDCQNTNTSDDLAVEVTLILGANASNSTISAKLINVTDATESNLGSYVGVKADIFAAASSNIYPYFGSGNLANDTSLSAINVTKVSVTASSSININPSIKRYLGNSSILDRGKYFNLHSTGGNDTEPNFFTDYNATQHGRGFWGPASKAVQEQGQVGVYPSPKSGTNEIREVSRYIATEHPYNIYEEGINLTTLSDWVVEYFKNFVGVNLRPEFYEPMNEPFVHARDFYSEPDWTESAENRVKQEMAQVFKEIGSKMHATPELVNMKVIGYAAAWPSFEKNNFAVWNENMKMFMDMAGADMDAFSTHLYDGVNQVGQDTKRSGSNMEAVLDLIESYSYEKWGIVKPHVISEFGGIVGSTYSDINNVQSIRSQNAMLFGLFERQDITELVIPFTTGKSTWHITEDNNNLPYKAVLFKPIPFGVPKDQITSWEYTDRIYFYDLWKNVEGERILIRSNHPDVQAQGFRNGNKLYVALNNLEDVSHTLNLAFDETNLPSVNEVRIKSLIVNSNELAQFSDQTSTTIPSTYDLAVNETVVFEYTYNTAFSFNNALILNRHYNNESTVQPIIANSPMSYTFSNVPTSSVEYATLRMSIGRKHDRSKSPAVVLNGQTLSVPAYWKGYDQANRDDFFGMIEIDVPIEYLQSTTTVSLEFPDSNGHVSSLVLITEAYDANLLSNDDSIKQLPKEKLLIYPNPSLGFVNLDNAMIGKLVKIFDLTGKKVHNEKYDGKAIDLHHLPTGVYIVSVNKQFAKIVIK